MDNLNLLKIKNVHFIGIGGIGISAIARMMIEDGKNVTGQDMQDSKIIEDLKGLGIKIKIGQSYENIPNDTDLIIYTIAIEYYAPELFKQLKYSEVGLPNIRNFVIRSYPEMLGEVSKDKYTIAISGTHGKTTTTAMIAKILKDTGKDPSVVIGSLIKSNEGSRTNFIGGHSEYFVIEACEYRRSFLNINPKVLIITNIDEDHLDYYKDIEDIKDAFRELVNKVPNDGFIICNPDDDNISSVIRDAKAKIINWNDFYNDKLKLKIPGIHNKKDAAAASATVSCFGISSDQSDKSLVEFSGTWRRFEFRGRFPNGVLLYDDYGHHPTEIMATLQGFRELYSKDNSWHITVVFQPHLFSRTKLLINQFAQAFKDADQVMLLPIYYAREIDDGSISSEKLAFEINKYTDNAESFSSFISLENNLLIRLKKMTEKNIIITLGAGEAFKVGDFLLKG